MSAFWDWLTTPLSGAATHVIAPWVYWHARLMVLAWAVLMPLGGLAARYFKVLPSQAWPTELDNKFWWRSHRTLQWSGLALTTLGAWIIWQPSPVLAPDHAPWARIHGWAGWLLVLLGWSQIFGGLARGSKGGPSDRQHQGDHYDMSPRRVWFERIHKSLGWACLLLSIPVILAGLVLADAPRWMPLALCVWWLSLAALAWMWQQQGRCIDTYQAIWGPDARHPGNRRPPIGWGIRRPFHEKNHGPS